MEIDINNYETVLIDYFDGNLNALEVAEVLLFLEQHPEIKNEFEAFGTLPMVENIMIDLDFKSNLKKLHAHQTLVDKSFNELIIAQLEGDCSEKESNIIHEIIESNASLIQLKNTFELTKLVPDLFINYPNKKSLKRKEAVVFYMNKRFVAAAALLLLASLLFLIYRNSNSNIDKVEVAQTKDNFIESNQVKEQVKAIEEAQPQKNIAEKVKEKSPNNHFTEPSNILNNAPVQLAEAIPSGEHIKSLPVKPLANIENSIVFDDKLISGDLIRVEIVASKEVSKAEDFLTIGNFMKKKIIERGKDNLIEKEKPIDTEELAMDPLTVASVGAGILEKTTGKKVFLSRSFDKSGSVKSYTFAAGDFKFERIK
jgi:hypothetical protein